MYPLQLYSGPTIQSSIGPSSFKKPIPFKLDDSSLNMCPKSSWQEFWHLQTQTHTSQTKLYEIKSTKLDLLNETHQTKPKLINQTFETKLSKVELWIVDWVEHSRRQKNSNPGPVLPLAMFISGLYSSSPLCRKNCKSHIESLSCSASTLWMFKMAKCRV